MKCILVADNYLPANYILEAFKRLEALGIQNKVIEWGKGISPQEFIRKVRNLEEKGPEAEEPPPSLIKEVRDADFLVVHFAPVPASIIEAGENLKMIGCLRGGFENIDINAATKRKIPVLNVPGRNADAVADFTMGLLIAIARSIVEGHVRLRIRHIWSSGMELLGQDLMGKTLGLVGFGMVARKVAKRAAGFGLKVVAYDPYVPENVFHENGVEPVSLQRLLKESDFVSIHARLSPETRKLISAREIALMKPSAYLINTARGPIVDSDALYRALKEKRIAGAALDVFDQEPINMDSPLLTLENVILTPHLAGATKEALFLNAPMSIASEIERYLRGEKLRYAVNPSVLE